MEFAQDKIDHFVECLGNFVQILCSAETSH